MQKSVGIVIGVIIVVLLLAVVWMFRGRPAGETTAPVEELTTTSPIIEELGAPASPAPVISPAASPSPVAQQNTVTITATGFTPATLTVPVGSSVTFTNSDTKQHQVASSPHPVHTNYPPLNGPVLKTGESRTVTFASAGTYSYHDHLNPGLLGKVVVE